MPPIQDKLKQSISDIRELSRLSPESFQAKLQNILADAGVSLILAPHLPGTFVHGATFWLGKDKAVVMMSIRGKWADIFWFSLFHELGHILLHDRNSVFLETDNDEYALNNKEKEADNYASDVLIPPSEYGKFIKKGNFYKDRIAQFADEIQIPPGIVVGRLQHDGHIKREWHNDLRTRYDWK